MARIKLLPPDNFSFHTKIPVRITDVNYGGHVGNDAILGLLHEVRMQFLQHYNFTEMELGGSSLIMSDVAIEFKSELFYGDSLMAYATGTELSRVGFDIFYKLTKTIEAKEITVALAKTGMICFDYTSKKITAVPDVVRKTLFA
jgi:acyl-CoA thioester hydrolase